MAVNKPVASIIIAVILLMALFFFVIPEYQQSLALAQSITTKQLMYQNESSYHTAVAQDVMKIESHGDAFAKMQSALPNAFTIAPIVYYMEQLGAQTGAIVTSISYSGGGNTLSATGASQIKEVALEMNVTANYTGFKSFIGALDTSSRIFQVNTVSMSPIGNANNVQLFNFQLQVTTQSY